MIYAHCLALASCVGVYTSQIMLVPLRTCQAEAAVWSGNKRCLLVHVIFQSEARWRQYQPSKRYAAIAAGRRLALSLLLNAGIHHNCSDTHSATNCSVSRSGMHLKLSSSAESKSLCCAGASE